MHFASIASGSSGNCLYVGSNNTNILIDTGISRKRIEDGLKNIGMNGSDIDAVLITHEHSDHVKGLGVWIRKYHVPVFATTGTFLEIERMNSLGRLDTSLFHPIRADESFMFGDVNISAISVSHDARDPVCYRIDDCKKSLGTVTDLGKFDDHITNSLKGCDMLYVEANHDIGMLQTGPYPYSLKMRIAGNYGHLSNEMSGQLIGRLSSSRLKNVMLGHLSKENNFPDLALRSVETELCSDYPGSADSFILGVAPRDHNSDLITV